jgi:hypothetical protein
MLMYAIIAVVGVLLVVLLLLVNQRRKKAGLSAQTKSQSAPKSASKSAPKSAPSRRSTRADKSARYAELRQAAESAPAVRNTPSTHYAAVAADIPPQLPQTPLPPAGYAPPAVPMLPTAPAPRAQSVPMEDILPGSDPLQAVILDLLHGWGDLTQEDTNRLGVFRPDRVVAAVTSAEIPKELKSSEYARARLSQLRRWTSGLEQSAARREQEALAAQHEYAAIGTAPAVAATPLAAAVAQPLVTPAPAAPPAVAQPATPFFQTFPSTPEGSAASVAEPSALATPAPVAAAAPAPIGVPPAPTPAMVPRSLVTPAPAMVTDAALWKSDMAEASKSTEAAIAAAAAAFWARPELGGTLPEAAPPARPAPPLAPPIPQAAPPAEAEPDQTAPQAPDFLPLGQELPILTVSTPVVEAPSAAPLQQVAQPTSFAGSDSDTFLEDLKYRISTAEALLALPANEQTGMLAFLKPSELARVLQATGDSELKKAVIDTLESVGSPSALDIIYHCLDDADPQIQSKALEAADRLLGAE